MGIILSIRFEIVTMFNANKRWQYLSFVAYLFVGILATSILRKNYCRGGGSVVPPCPKLSILSQSNVVRFKKILRKGGGSSWAIPGSKVQPGLVVGQTTYGRTPQKPKYANTTTTGYPLGLNNYWQKDVIFYRIRCIPW